MNRVTIGELRSLISEDIPLEIIPAYPLGQPRVEWNNETYSVIKICVPRPDNDISEADCLHEFGHIFVAEKYPMEEYGRGNPLEGFIPGRLLLEIESAAWNWAFDFLISAGREIGKWHKEIAEASMGWYIGKYGSYSNVLRYGPEMTKLGQIVRIV